PEFNHYVQLGYGNYASPLAALGTNYPINQSLSIIGDAFYESYRSGPVNDRNSGSSFGRIHVSLPYETEKILLTPRVSYQANGFNFYGNTNRIFNGFPSEPAPEAAARDLQIDVEVKGKGKSINYFFQPQFFRTNHLLKDSASINKETGFQFQGTFDIRLDSAFDAGVDIQGNQSAYSGLLSYDRSLFKLTPWVTHLKGNLLIKAGFTVASGEISDINSESGFYPFAKLDWDFDEKWKLFGFFDSNIQWNGLNTRLTENPFLEDSLVILNTRVTSSFGGGIKGTLADRLSIKAEARLENVEDLPFYIPSASDSSRFTLVYDERTVNVVTVQSEASLAIGHHHDVTLHVQLMDYTTKTEDEPWHLPTYIIKLLTSHKLKEKLLISTELIMNGGIKVPVNNAAGIGSLSDFADFNLNTTYIIDKRTSMFVKVNNIFGSEYERYLGYPVRGLTFKVGGKYRF
ncbi:MAG: hypothetical protein AAF551_09280, partial [Bacteroidota bacterium]